MIGAPAGPGKVTFVGAGPGAADLITLRGAAAIAAADVVVWAGSLVHPDVLAHARADAQVIDSAALPMEGVLPVYRTAAAEGLSVARVHSGDPSLWGAVAEQLTACQELGLVTEVVPGVSAFSAAAAAIQRELTVPEVAQSVILTRLGGGKTPMPPGEEVRSFARHGTTMAIFLSAARSGPLAAELAAGGYPPQTPVVVAYQVSWPDERVLHCTVATVEATVKEHRLWKHTLFLVGPALTAGGTRSHLYHPGHFHGFRRAEPSARRALREAALRVSPLPSPNDPPPSDPPPSDPPRERPEVGRGPRLAPVTVVGCDGAPLSPDAREALAAATLLLGARRHLAAVAGLAGTAAVTPVRTHVLGSLQPALDALTGHVDAGAGPAVVLASGDPGFFGIVRALRGRGMSPAVLPARSSVALAFAALGLSWDDALVVSAHGRGGGRDVRRAALVCRSHPKVAVLTAPGAGPRELAEQLRGTNRTLVVAENLGEPGQQVRRVSPEEAAGRADWADPNVVLVFDPTRPEPTAGWITGGPATGPGGWALPEGVFAHRDSMITKAEVRAVVLARLGPRRGEAVWDVGAGSGSVAVECARFGAAVFAVDRDPGACGRIRANAAGHEVTVQTVQALAPEGLAGLPDPDAVFVGGGGASVVRACLARRPRVLVATVAAVDRVAGLVTELGTAGYRPDGVLLSASRLAPLPGATHRLTATNPVFVLWGYQADQADHDREEPR